MIIAKRPRRYDWPENPEDVNAASQKKIDIVDQSMLALARARGAAVRNYAVDGPIRTSRSFTGLRVR